RIRSSSRCTIRSKSCEASHPEKGAPRGRLLFFPSIGRSGCLSAGLQRLAERLEQGAVDRVTVRIIFGVPLHAERKARRIRDADRLDGAVLRHAFDDNAFAGLLDALAVQ